MPVTNVEVVQDFCVDNAMYLSVVQEFCVDNAMYLSGWRMRVGNSADSAASGR